MAFQRTSLSAAGASTPIQPRTSMQDWTGGGVSLLVNFSGGGPAVATVSVQISNDPTAMSSPSTARWNNHDTLASLTANANGTASVVIYAVRLFASAYTSGTVTLDMGQGDQL